MNFKRSGLAGCATRSPGGSTIRVRLVQLILTNQNELPGYIAEAQLSLDIINWFAEVPWKQTLREASEAGLSEHREKLSRCGRDGLDPLE